jgi:hypothetical protein
MTADHSYIRGTFLGHFLRFISKGEFLRYPEERDPSLYAAYLVKDDASQTGGLKDRQEQQRQTSGQQNEQSSIEDTEKGLQSGRDPMIVDWYGSDDPEVSLRVRSEKCSQY